MGRFWAGTISLKKIQGTAALYCLDAQQSITQKLAANLTNSNGLAWSADATRFFILIHPCAVFTPTNTTKTQVNPR